MTKYTRERNWNIRMLNNRFAYIGESNPVRIAVRQKTFRLSFGFVILDAHRLEQPSVVFARTLNDVVSEIDFLNATTQDRVAAANARR